ncbi:MAG: hypothetical protein ACOC1X_00365 [Promethearchaeota archaeon]
MKISKRKKERVLKKKFSLHGRIQVRENIEVKKLGGEKVIADVLTAKYSSNKQLAEVPFPENKFNLYKFPLYITEIGCTFCCPPDGIETTKTSAMLWVAGVKWEGNKPTLFNIYKPNIELEISYYIC